MLYVVKDCADVGGTCQGAADKVGVTEEVLVLLEAGETAWLWSTAGAITPTRLASTPWA